MTKWSAANHRMSRWFSAYGFAEVHDQLLIGAYPLDEQDVDTLVSIGVQRVLNLVEDEEYSPGERETAAAALTAAGIEEHRLRLTDFGGLPAEAIEEAVREVSNWLDEGVRAYLHCRAGRQRSAAVAAGVIALREGIEIDPGLVLLQARKPSADPLPHQREDLRRWWHGRRETPDDARSYEQGRCRDERLSGHLQPPFGHGT